MLTQLGTVKLRLGLGEFEVKDDVILTNAIQGVSARFDRECNRTLARTVDLEEEFFPNQTEIRVRCFPIETVTRFELKRDEVEGWVETGAVKYLIRGGCVVSLGSALGTVREQARLIYTGGYVLPGTAAAAGQTALPDDLEQAAVEQVVYWYHNRERQGVIREWPKGGVYLQFLDLDLLPTVRAVLKTYQRWEG